MINFFYGPGFLGTNASFGADITLLLIMLTAIMFTIGWQLRVHKLAKYHCRIQAAATILNTFVVLSVMVSSFITNILPGIPGQLGMGFYAITTIHSVIGVICVGMGVFVVLCSYNLVPRSLRYKNKKLWMRASYVLYIITTLLGVIVYLIVYVGGS